MENFSWASPTKILFGRDQIKSLGKEITNRGFKKILITYGHSSIKKNGVYDAVIKELKAHNINHIEYSGIDPNPRIESVIEAGTLCKNENVDMILAVGGGSVVDCSKGIALFPYYNGDDFWQEIKNGTCSQIPNALPLGVVLTLSATGSEMNNGGVISNLTTKEKLALSSPLTHPIFSVLDPTYTYSVPKNQISAGVVDAFSHCLEQFFSKNDTSIVSDNILVGIMKSLKEIGFSVFTETNNYNAHANHMWAATMALNYISGVGKISDWATHQMEHAVSAYYDITHAVGLAVITPHWMEYVLDEQNAYRFKPLAHVFDINTDNLSHMEIAKKVISSTREFFASLGMPAKFKEIGITTEHLDGMVSSSMASSYSAKQGFIGNFKQLKSDDIKKILQHSIE